MIITLASLKGGSGKTTSATALAYYFATRRPKPRVVLADGDPNRTVIDWANSSKSTLPFVVTSANSEQPEHDIIIFDTAARTADEDLSELIEASSLLIIPTRLDIYDIRATIALAQTLEKAPDRYRILLTGIPPRGKRLFNEAQAMFDDAGLMSFDSGIRYLAVYRDAAFHGTPIAMYSNAGKKAFQDYQLIGKTIQQGWM